MRMDFFCDRIYNYKRDIISWFLDAGIPKGAELNVTEVRSDNYISETADTLGWTDEDYILYTKFFDISIVKDGVEIEPKSPVSVTAELLDVEEEAEALQVVHFDKNGAEEVESQPTDEAAVTFETESFSVYGFGTALRTVMSEKTILSIFRFTAAGVILNLRTDRLCSHPPKRVLSRQKRLSFRAACRPPNCG